MQIIAQKKVAARSGSHFPHMLQLTSVNFTDVKFMSSGEVKLHH